MLFDLLVTLTVCIIFNVISHNTIIYLTNGLPYDERKEKMLSGLIFIGGISLIISKIIYDKIKQSGNKKYLNILRGGMLGGGILISSVLYLEWSNIKYYFKMAILGIILLCAIMWERKRESINKTK